MPIIYIDMECLRLVVIMKMLSTCVQISALWFASLRSEELVLVKVPKAFLVDSHHEIAEIHMRTKFHFHALHDLQV